MQRVFSLVSVSPLSLSVSCLSLQESAVIPSHADLSFTVLLFNADSAGNPLEHFSAEEAGQTSQILLITTADRQSVFCLNKFSTSTALSLCD